MASGVVTLHVVLCECSEAELVERVTGIIAEHVSQAREGVVPVLLAEDLVTRLRAQNSLILEPDLDGDDA